MLLCRVLYKARNFFAHLAYLACECISVLWTRVYHYVVVTAALVSIVSLVFSLSALFSLLDQLAELCHVNLRRAGHLIGSSHTLKGPGPLQPSLLPSVPLSLVCITLLLADESSSPARITAD